MLTNRLEYEVYKYPNSAVGDRGTRQTSPVVYRCMRGMAGKLGMMALGLRAIPTWTAGCVRDEKSQGEGGRCS